MIEANYYPPNGYPYTTCSDLRGTSNDTKPLDVPEGSTFHEWDTGNEYMFDGEEWLLQTSGGGGGGGSFGNQVAFLYTEITDGQPDQNGLDYSAGVYASKNDYENDKAIIGSVSGGPSSANHAIASGAFLYIDPDQSPADTVQYGLFIIDNFSGVMTEIQDAVEIDAEDGEIYGFMFTMPAAESDKTAILGIVTS